MFRKIVEIIKAAFKNDVHPSTAHGQEIKLTISTETTEHYVDRFIADGIEVSHLNLGGYQSPSGGYVNWTRYEVKGKNAATNRKNTRRYAARSESALASIAAADGLLEPYEIRVMPNDAPTDKQIEYLHSWNVEVPVGAVKEDVSAILSRLEDSYSVVAEERISPSKSVERIRPLDGPSEEFAQYADAMGILFSKYIGEVALFNRTVYCLKERDKAAFFAYCVLCDHYHREIGDLQTTEYFNQLYSFADMATANASIMRSIGNREASDYIKPHKGSAAYKAVAEFFGIK
ncbi:MAG: hypothetical protein J6Q53_04375 [Oscillospiraceae bacterium]|nr:hypothetical protein [Oscillospiraceae bacterium]